MTIRIRRGFIDLPQAQIHYRSAGIPGGRRPLVMIHASPASSRMLEPLIRQMATDRLVIAPDTLGNGDSTGPIPDGSGIGFFADAMLAAVDAFGLSEFDLYGTHTGASIAADAAIRYPDRIRSVILDGVGLYEPDFQKELVERYAPALTIDHQGMYLAWIWHFVRDTFMFWPWYRLDAAHRRSISMPPARELHAKVLEVLKAAETYHHPYRAAMRYDKRGRLPQLRLPVLATCAREDMLKVYFDELVALMPGCQSALTDGVGTEQAAAATAGVFRQFIDSHHI